MFTLSSLAPAFSVSFKETSEKSASEGASVSIDVESLRGTDASSARERSGAPRASGSARVDDAAEPVASAFEASAPFPEDVAREWVLDGGHAEAVLGANALMEACTAAAEGAAGAPRLHSIGVALARGPRHHMEDFVCFEPLQLPSTSDAGDVGAPVPRAT